RSRLTAWQKNYAKMWPDSLPAEPLEVPEDSKWKYDELLNQLTGSKARFGSVENGAELFASVGCADCHRFGDLGEDTAPELTSVGKRLMKKQVLRAMLQPSHTVATRYLSGTLSSDDTSTSLSDDSTAVDDESDSAASTDDENDASDTRKTSPMPEGLLDDLTLEQVVDLFTYLTTTPDLSVAERLSDEPVR
ncbi:MAG: c-type cytochrome, partial [Planctomycetes bacterium]|nr:c-type cytochrome [Planctomycetota bacterium]